MYNQLGKENNRLPWWYKMSWRFYKAIKECLDIVFPNSKKIEFESDKINYILSTVFFLSNRLAKATIGLTELDKAIGDIEKIGKQSLDSKENTSHYEKMKKELDEILAKYFW